MRTKVNSDYRRATADEMSTRLDNVANIIEVAIRDWPGEFLPLQLEIAGSETCAAINWLRRLAEAQPDWTPDGLRDYFGVCPHCQKNDGMINIGREHWYYCKEHKVTWCVGANLFSGWKKQTEDEQRKIFDDLGFGEFQTVESTTHAKEFERHVIDDDIPF